MLSHMNSNFIIIVQQNFVQVIYLICQFKRVGGVNTKNGKRSSLKQDVPRNCSCGWLKRATDLGLNGNSDGVVSSRPVSLPRPRCNRITGDIQPPVTGATQPKEDCTTAKSTIWLGTDRRKRELMIDEGVPQWPGVCKKTSRVSCEGW